MKAELKTLKDCKNEVAKNHRYMNWSSLIAFRSDLVVLFVDELFTLYARIQIEKDREDLINDIIGDESGSDLVDMIKNRLITLY